MKIGKTQDQKHYESSTKFNKEMYRKCTEWKLWYIGERKQECTNKCTKYGFSMYQVFQQNYFSGLQPKENRFGKKERIGGHPCRISRQELFSFHRYQVQAARIQRWESNETIGYGIVQRNNRQEA